MAINILLKKKEVQRNDILFPEIQNEARESGWTADHEEGQLAVDVYETDHEIFLKSAIAGVTIEDLDVFLHNDMLTVRGVRHAEEKEDARYMVRECHWGPFSRSVILPTDIDPETISAVLKDGVLTICMTKIERSKKIEVNEID